MTVKKVETVQRYAQVELKGPINIEFAGSKNFDDAVAQAKELVSNKNIFADNVENIDCDYTLTGVY